MKNLERISATKKLSLLFANAVAISRFELLAFDFERCCAVFTDRYQFC